jgi:hypothetical protein
MESFTSLNCAGGSSRSATSQLLVLKSRIEELTWETSTIDSSQQPKESTSMFRELGKVLVDHLKRRLKDSIENRSDLRRKQGLYRQP